MARPLKTYVDWFPHSADTTRGTVAILTNKYGNDGYAFWFRLLELLCRCEGLVYDTAGKGAWRILLAATGVSSAKARSMLDLLASLGKVDSKQWKKGKIYVPSLKNRLKELFRRREHDRERKRIIHVENPDFHVENPVIHVENPPIIHVENPDFHVENPVIHVENSNEGETKKSPPLNPPKRTSKSITRTRVKEKTANDVEPKLKGSVFTPPTVEEVGEYVREKGYKVDALRFWDYYNSTGWVQGKNCKPLKSWKSAVRTWQYREEKPAAAPAARPGRPDVNHFPGEYDPDVYKNGAGFD